MPNDNSPINPDVKSPGSTQSTVSAPLKKPPRVKSWQKKFAYYLTRFPVNTFFMIFYGLRIYGRENMPKTGPLLVVSNHQSHFDPPLIAAGLRRQLNFLARKTLFKFKPFAWLIGLLDAIPLETNGIGFEGIKECLRRLKGGEAILLFPEGARTWDGEIAPFKPGAVSLAKRGKATILPMAIDGCFAAWPRTNKFPWLFSNKIRVIYGEPVPYEELKDLSDADLEKLVRDRMEELFASIRVR